MKATTERSINLSPFLFGESTAPITIVWLCALTFVGVALLWFWTPYSFGRKQRKEVRLTSFNVEGETKDILSDQNQESKTEPDKHNWSYHDFNDYKDSTSSLQLVRRFAEPRLTASTSEYSSTGFGTHILRTNSDNDATNLRSEETKRSDGNEINNNFLAENKTKSRSNGNVTKVSDSSAFVTNWTSTDAADNLIMVKPRPVYPTRIFTRSKKSANDIDNEKPTIAVVESSIPIPTFKDFLFDLSNVLPVKIPEVKKLGYYIKWNNGHPNFYLKEPFDPMMWVYSEPEYLPLDLGNFNLEENFPEGPNEHYNNLTQEIKYMSLEDLSKLARSLHLATFATIDVLQYRIRKTYELQINAMETRKAAMTGWVPNYRHYQHMYPVHGKGWFDYVVVVDFECTCEDGTPPDFQNEIIQFPAVLIDTRNRVIIDEFNVYVKPTENPKLTAFCTNLTGITQETVNEAPTFPVALKMFSDWLKSHRLGDNDFTIVTDGPTDMGKFLLEQCQLSGIEYPAFARRWINIRKVFSSFYGIRWFNLKIMMNIIGMPFEGCHHNGADDARNIATIFLRLLHDGCLAFQNEQIVLDKSLQCSNYHNRSFYLNSVIPFNQYHHNPYASEDSRFTDTHLAKESGSTYFYLPEIFSTLGNKENAVMHPINCDSGKKRERKLFNVVTKLAGNDTGSSKSKNYSPAASRS